MLLTGVVLKFVPVIVTDVPMEPLVGVKDEIVGADVVVTVNCVAEFAVCPPTVTEIVTAPETPEGTVTTIEVSLQLVGVAVTVPNLIVLVPCVVLKFVPLIVTVVPTAPLLGVNEVIDGEDD